MHKKLLPALLFLVAPGLMSAQNSTGWKAGAAHIDITPDHPVRLSGYGSRTTECDKVAARIHANALALQWQGGAPAVIITVDNCGVPAAVRTEVLKRLAAAGKTVQDERFALHSTHTHCAPMLKGVLPFMFGADLPADQQERVDRYTEELTEKMVKTIGEALGKMQPAQLDWGGGKVYFAYNRRLKTETGFQNAQNFNGPATAPCPCCVCAPPMAKNSSPPM
jgi:neutral ceramidase